MSSLLLSIALILLAVALILLAVALFSLRAVPPAANPAEIVTPVLGVVSGLVLVYVGLDLFGSWDETARMVTEAARRADGPREIIPGQHAGATGMVHAAPLILIGVGTIGTVGFSRRVLTMLRGY